MTQPSKDAPQDDQRLSARSSVSFPRLELPLPPFKAPASVIEAPAPSPVPTSAPATNLDGRPIGGYDEPVTGTWQSPFPAPVIDQGYVYQVVPPPQIDASNAVVPAPAAEAASTVPLPDLAPVPEPATATVVAPSKVVLGAFAVLAAALVWASTMAFSAALLALGALLASEIALALAASRPSAAVRSTPATAVAVVAGIAALLAAKGAFAQFGETAFVAGLFVLVSAVPTLLVLGIVAFVLRRRSASGNSPGERALRAGALVRFGALAAIIAAGVQAHKTFSAVPDAVVALAVVVLAALNVAAALRGTGRAAA